jgi:CRP-like cAMP-binding protein
VAAGTKPSRSPANRLLRKLPPAELALLLPHLEPVTLKRRESLEQPQKTITHLYFMEQGIASVVTANNRNVPVEIGLVGREGVTGLAVILGSSSSPHSTFIQVAGGALRIAVKPMLKALDHSKALRSLLLRYAHVFMVQTAHTAAANAKGSIEERLARWLLMARDRLDDEKVPLTHDFLSVMLGTRRPGVTEAVHALLKQGLIRTDRGVIFAVDRKGLSARAGCLYGAPEAEYRQQIGEA